MSLSTESCRSRTSRRPRVITRGVYYENLDRIETDPRVDPPPRTCFNCWEAGHVFEKCPLPLVEMCPNCGRHEVNLETCPRCQRAFRETSEGKRPINGKRYRWNPDTENKTEKRNQESPYPRGRAMLNVRVPNPFGNGARGLGSSMSLASSIKCTLGDSFDKQTIRDNNSETTDYYEEDDFATANYENSSLDEAATNTDYPSSTGATCCGTSDMIERVTNLLEKMAPLSASTQNLVMKGIFNNDGEYFIEDGTEFSIETNTGENISM